ADSGEQGISFETITEINELGVSDRTLQRRLATLVEQGHIEPIGHTRALRYRKLVGSADTADTSEQSVAPSAEPAATDSPPVIFASSELTGGAGFTFEDAVAATYYAALIAQTKSVPGLPDRILCRVARQQASNGEPLDDLVVDGGASDSSLARLSLQ